MHWVIRLVLRIADNNCKLVIVPAQILSPCFNATNKLPRDWIPDIPGWPKHYVEISRQFFHPLDLVNLRSEFLARNAMVQVQSLKSVVRVSGQIPNGTLRQVRHIGTTCIVYEHRHRAGDHIVYEVVPPPGHVHLNRPNLIVLTSPRLLPFLGQVMEADPHLRFRADEQGWYVRDESAGVDYRSPRDRGETADYGYVGRLPRPDGKGTFLYLAGTHAQGTLGAAQYLAQNLGELYKELKNRRFSTLVRAHYNTDDPRKIVSTERFTPLYRPEGA